MMIEDQTLRPVLDVESDRSFEVQNVEAVLDRGCHVSLGRTPHTEVEKDSGHDETDLLRKFEAEPIGDEGRI